jgi:hypothetical protein
MNHKLTLWPSIAAIVMWLTPLRCQEKIEPPKPILEFKLLEPGIPSFPNIPPVLPKTPILPDNKNLSYS